MIVDVIIDAGRPVPMRQAIELSIGFLHRSFQRLFRERWRPQAACFAHAAPNRLDAHRRFFGTDVRFDQDFNGNVCRRRTAARLAVSAVHSHLTRAVRPRLDRKAAHR